ARTTGLRVPDGTGLQDRRAGAFSPPHADAVAVAVRAARSIDSQSAIRSASSSPYWRKVRNFSGAFSGSTVTAEKTRLPYTALAAAYRGGGISAIPGGARLPPLRN